MQRFIRKVFTKTAEYADMKVVTAVTYVLYTVEPNTECYAAGQQALTVTIRYFTPNNFQLLSLYTKTTTTTQSQGRIVFT